MAVQDEIAIEGHEPRPIGEYFPTLAKETGWATDISWFKRLGDAIVFVHRRDGQSALRDCKDSLLCSIRPRESAKSAGESQLLFSDFIRS
jgi:hypothetical protein